jgi:hypothetical protein
MSNRLNYSSLTDAWGVDNTKPEEPKKFAYQKPKENIMTINSNEIMPIKKEFKPVQETYSEYIKPCSLVEEHINKCEICRNKLVKNTTDNSNKSILDKLTNTKEHMTSKILSMSNEYLDYNYDINEHFDNISPSQKNLLIVVLYGILIILISDLIIKEENE